MWSRLGRAVVLILFAIVTFFIGGLVLTGGYWISDLVYDAGLWPVGALIRIVLFIFLIGWVLRTLSLLYAALAMFFVADMD